MRPTPFRHKFYAAAALVSLTLGSAHAQLPLSSAAATPKVALSLSKYQAESGLIGTFANGPVADPYFGLYAINLAEKGGLDVTEVREKFIKWGLAEQKPDGSFNRYCKKNGIWKSCGKADSDDATLVRWIHLLYSAAPYNKPLPPAWQASANTANTALKGLRMKNGIYSVFSAGTPGYKNYALFKDNVEVLSLLRQTASVLTLRNETLRAAQYTRRAEKLKTAMIVHFGVEPFKAKSLALGASYDKPRFYPHAVAIPFGWLEGYYAAPTKVEWDMWLKLYTQDWLKNAKKDFPWGLMALSALYTGEPAVAGCWAKRHGAQSETGQHWNVLEEVSLQVIKQARPPATNCPVYAP